MVISRSIIANPRVIRKCDECGAPINVNCVRLYGYAERGDPPYALYLHAACDNTRLRPATTPEEAPA